MQRPGVPRHAGHQSGPLSTRKPRSMSPAARALRRELLGIVRQASAQEIEQRPLADCHAALAWPRRWRDGRNQGSGRPDVSILSVRLTKGDPYCFSVAMVQQVPE